MPTPGIPQPQHQRTPPRLYSLDFFDAPDVMDPFGWGYLEIRRERFERMLMAQDIPAKWAMLLLYSSWPPEGLRGRATEIIANSLPPKVAGLGAEIAAKDMSARHKQSKPALYRDLLLEGTFLAAADINVEANHRRTVLLETVDLYNRRLRQTPLLMIEGITQRQQIVHEVQRQHSNLDPATLDWVLHEVGTAVRRNPRLAGMPVEVPVDYMWELNGPKWETEGASILCRDLAAPPPYDVPLLDWANRCAQDLFRSIYKHARHNLLDWRSSKPRLKPARDEIGVTAQRRQPQSGSHAHGQNAEVEPSAPQDFDPAAVYISIDMLRKAIKAVDSPAEQQIVQMLIDGLSPAEMAQALNANRSAVYKRIERMRRKLEPMLR